MRLLLALILMLPALAQQPAAQPEAPKPEEAKPAEAKPAGAAPAEAASPAPSTEQWISGSIDVGNRWLSDVRGSSDAFRSVVNLGEGPRLTGLDVTLQDPKRRLFDRIDARGLGWGGDPYNTAHVDARKQGVYDFRFDYRNIAYFNALPSYANPNLGQGILFSQHQFDTHRRMNGFQLDLMPGRRIVPYFAYQRDGGRGRGVTNFVGEGNEYAVPTIFSDKTDNYRGGVRLEMNRFHVTLEQGATAFEDDQRVYADQRNPGNRTTPLIGQTLTLANLNQQYGITADSLYSKVLVTANPAGWVDLFGHFLYSQPETTVRYNHNATGNFAVLSSLLFYTGQQDVATGQAKAPHSSANFGFELRPVRRVRIIESLMLDRMHNASFGLLTETLLLGGGNQQTQLPLALNDRLVLNYNQQQIDVLVDVTSRITVRGGHRYVWGDATVRAGQLNPFALDSRELKRQVGLAGFTIRPVQRLSVNADYEGASSERTYFRTSLYDYQRARLRARYQAFGSLALQAGMGFLSNQNPSPGVNYDFFSRDTSLSAFWTPAGGKRVTLTAEYMRSTLRSDIDYLVPQDLRERERSFYRDNGHTATTLVDIALPSYGGTTPRVAVGGSLFVSSGSRPTSYYQPLARVSLPLQKHVFWTSEWRWYGFGENFYQYEGFRAHTFTTGLRLVR